MIDDIATAMRRQETSEFKLGPQSFTRAGALQPELLITLLLYMVGDGGRRGYRHLLSAFWDEAKDRGVRLPTDQPVSAAAFCNARTKLKPAAIRSLLHSTVDAFEQQHGASHRFRGRRVFAVDGAKVCVQRSRALWAEFGGPADGPTPQIMITTLLDVIAKLPIDATVSPFRSSERDQLADLTARLSTGDVLVLDRGYPSYEVVAMLMERHLDFVVRVPTTSHFPAVDDFVNSSRDEAEVMLVPPRYSSVRGQGPFVVRAVRRDGPAGEPQVFLTTLSRKEFSHSEICELYRRRWEVELFFRLAKGNYLGHEQFHARNPDGVRQEVFAHLLFVALGRTLMTTAAEIHGVLYEEISQKGALMAVAERFVVLLVQRPAELASQCLDDLLHRITRSLDRHRRRPSYPRRSFKPRPRWTPSGHANDPERRVHIR